MRSCSYHLKFNSVVSALWLCLTAVPAWAVVVPTEEWVARYNGPGNLNDVANAMAIDSSGNIYVTGFSTGAGPDGDYATIKYDTAGSELWVARYDGPEPGGDNAQAITVDSVGNVYVTGYSPGLKSMRDYATVKYDSAGNELWVARYAGSGKSNDIAYGIVGDSAGNVYVTGFSTEVALGETYTTIKYDSAGNEIWVAHYKGDGNVTERAAAIAIDSQDNIIVTGNSASSTTISDYATVKYDSAGNELWVARYNGPGDWIDFARAISIDNADNIYVAGSSVGLAGNSDYATIKYDSAGNELWVARFNGPDNGHDAANALAVDGNGNVVVTGFSNSSVFGNSDGWDYATVKYDSAGNELWVARYSGPGNNEDEARALVIDRNGSIYITGSSSSGLGTAPDYATVKYDGNGNELWIARYSGPGNNSDEAHALAIDRDGNVFVAGGSRGRASNYDYATIKYSKVKDTDNDGIFDDIDNCPDDPNVNQADHDEDGLGDACDDDDDNDTVLDINDNCPLVFNPNQADVDGDGLGDVCDPDVDGDGVANDGDLCPVTQLGAVTDSAGCSIAQLCPCEGPRRTTISWRNHGNYVACVANTAKSFVGYGLINKTDGRALVSAARQSNCGAKK